MKNRYRFVFRTVAALSLLTILLTIPSALVGEDEADLIIYTADSTPLGMTYGDWQAAYWQYIFSIPVNNNPILDTTGAYCDVAQSGGPVFYLNSTFFGPFLTRSCTVPASKALLVPLAVWECSNIESDPFHGENPQDMRECAGIGADGIGVNTLKLTVDGKKVSGLKRMRAQSPYYYFTIPTDNILGLSDTSGYSVSDGYMVMLKPLSRGHHVIHAEGGFVSGPLAGALGGVTYYLTVQ
jgi:hypothetical protein